MMTVLAAFEWSFLADHWREFFDGLVLTLKASAIAVVLSFGIGIVLGACRAFRIPVVSQAAAVYVEVIRNTPLLVQIFFIFFGLPQFGILLEPFTAAWVALTIWGGAFMTENFRAAFEAVPVRYREGAFALGFGPLPAFFNVTLPIGARVALPSTINTTVSILKNTAVLGPAISFPELTYVAYSLESVTFRALEIYTFLALLYLVVVWIISFLMRLLERRLALPEDRPRGARGTPRREVIASV